jgi:hypothetical protein
MPLLSLTASHHVTEGPSSRSRVVDAHEIRLSAPGSAARRHLADFEPTALADGPGDRAPAICRWTERQAVRYDVCS